MSVRSLVGRANNAHAAPPASVAARSSATPLQRYPSDDAKATLRQAMADPENQTRYRQRQAMVELVSSILRQPRGVNRFRRRGVCAVRCEFALHVMAYNLGRAFLPLVVQAIGPFRS